MSPALHLDSTFTQLVLLGIGVALFAAGQISLRGYRLLMRHGRRTRGRIVALRGSGEDQEAQLRFVTDGGREISEWTTFGGVPGDELVIIYNPAQPSHYRVGDGAPLGFLAFSIAGGWLVAHTLWLLLF